MGGKALASIGIDTVRLNSVEYEETVKQIMLHLSVMYPHSKFHVVRGYRNKKDHGDVDILVERYDNMPNIEEALSKVKGWNAKGWYKNGATTSVEYHNFQVDLNFISPKNWETSKDFFDFDPSGNLMGKIAHKFGLKYGSAGLTYPYRGMSGKVVKDISISKDNRKIFEFLGFDYDRFLAGFDDVVEIFDYVIRSNYYNRNIFLYENLNHVDKKRNRKRKTYNEFLAYANDEGKRKTRGGIKYELHYNFKEDKNFYLDAIHDYFPEANLIEELNALNARQRELTEIHEKFNGKIIMNQVRYLRGSLLGAAIKNFKDQFESEDAYEKYVLANDKQTIMNYFLDTYFESIKVQP